MAVLPKKRRARRARAHWHGRRDGRDLRSEYRPGDLGPDGDLAPDGLAIVEFDDAYGALEPDAQLRRTGDAAPEWVVPPKPKIRAVARIKEDPLGRMAARFQIDRPLLLSGREYQRLHDTTQVALVRSVDLSKTKVSGGRHYDPLTDARQRASKKLRHADDALMHRHGVEGLSLVRDVLCERRSVEASARLRGVHNDRERRHWSWLFRKCLSVLAVQFGFANMTRRPPRPARLNGGDGGPDLQDPRMHADAAELGDPALRRGKPNGHGQ